jgi:NTP pyrophosphatase (non-canonical NTP hydrolase)
MTSPEATPLTFAALRAANVARLPKFKNAKGVAAHTKADGSDWIPAQWLQALVGELGEYANLRKKFERGDLARSEFDAAARDELADVVVYLDILAFQLGIDLGSAVVSKFNRTSLRAGCADIMLPPTVIAAPPECRHASAYPVVAAAPGTWRCPDCGNELVFRS